MSLATSDPQSHALIYAKKKENMTQQSLNDATKKAMGSDVKAYFEAEWDRHHMLWKIGRRVEMQDW